MFNQDNNNNFNKWVFCFICLISTIAYGSNVRADTLDMKVFVKEIFDMTPQITMPVDIGVVIGDKKGNIGLSKYEDGICKIVLFYDEKYSKDFFNENLLKLKDNRVNDLMNKTKPNLYNLYKFALFHEYAHCVAHKLELVRPDNKLEIKDAKQKYYRDHETYADAVALELSKYDTVLYKEYLINTIELRSIIDRNYSNMQHDTIDRIKKLYNMDRLNKDEAVIFYRKIEDRLNLL